MSQKKPLHLAKNIKNLEIIATNSGKLLSKIDKLCDCADKLYLCVKSDPTDDEKTFVYLIRYLTLIDEIRNITHDDRFVQSRFGTNYRRCKDLLSLLRKNLINRYNELYESDNACSDKPEQLNLKDQTAEEEVAEICYKLFASDLFTVCQEIYNLHLKKANNMLIIDIRPESEYNLSHMKDIHNINIPANYIKPGLSANALEISLPENIKQGFKNRASYDVLILTDWNTSSKKYQMSKLQVLYEILTKWEFKIIYKYKPFILDGGYLAWIEKYPTLSTNPHVMYNKKYSDLDELLYLDKIQYPVDMPNTTKPLVLNEQKSEPVSVVPPTTNNSLSKLHKVAMNQLNNEKGLLKTLKRMLELNKLLANCKVPDTVATYKKEKLDIHNEISKLESAKIQLEERKTKLISEFSLNSRFAPGNNDEVQSRMKEISLLDEEIINTYKQRKELNLISESDGENMDVIPPSDEKKSTKIGPVTTIKPPIDRRSKPMTMNYMPGTVKFISNGLTGLENIRNTCYMNTLLQCLRHLPPVYTFLCSGVYNIFLRRPDLSILKEFAEIVRNLWMNSYTVIRPTVFYKKLCKIEPMYGEGLHECVHMFFLYLLDTLHEDAVTDVDESHISNCATMAWLIKFKGKFSFFLKTFYHQIKETQVCVSCTKKAIRFQSEPTLMLAVPERRDFTLEEVLDDYLSNDYIICTKCKVQCKVTKVINYAPPILTITLKRYSQKGTKFFRNNNACTFNVKHLKVGMQEYDLHAVALHQGTLNSGHYTSACLNPTDNKWYEYNDAVVKPLDINNDKLKVKAYVLFYVSKTWKENL